MTRRCSSSGATGAAPGRVDSPPTSTMSAPDSASVTPCAMAEGVSLNLPPSEKLSGVTLTMPMIRGAARSSPANAARGLAKAASAASIARPVRGAAQISALS